LNEKEDGGSPQNPQPPSAPSTKPQQPARRSSTRRSALRQYRARLRGYTPSIQLVFEGLIVLFTFVLTAISIYQGFAIRRQIHLAEEANRTAAEALKRDHQPSVFLEEAFFSDEPRRQQDRGSIEAERDGRMLAGDAAATTDRYAGAGAAAREPPIASAS